MKNEWKLIEIDWFVFGVAFSARCLGAGLLAHSPAAARLGDELLQVVRAQARVRHARLLLPRHLRLLLACGDKSKLEANMCYI